MKKISKILLPIASTVAVVASAACMTSCGLKWEDFDDATWTWDKTSKSFTSCSEHLLAKHNYGFIFDFTQWQWEGQDVTYPKGEFKPVVDLFPQGLIVKPLAVYLIDKDDSTNEKLLTKDKEYEVIDEATIKLKDSISGINLQNHLVRTVWSTNLEIYAKLNVA